MRFVTVFFLVWLALSAAAEVTQPPFGDVPQEHWAAGAVNALAQAGVLKGYPDKTYRGDRCVTRYELAAALSGLAQYFERSRRPLVDEPIQKPERGGTGPSRETDPAKWLVAHGYLPKETLLAKDPKARVNPTLMADAMAAVLARMCDLDVKANPPKPLPTEKEWERK